MKLCSVQKCYQKGTTRHRFPNPLKYPARFREWLRRMGNAYLFEIDQMRIYNGYTVCASHFTPSDYDTNNRLKNTAIPNLQISVGKVQTI
jgi:hypothetical protein